MANRQEGLIHLYVGDGKGKTTAAMGLAVRAKGAGKRVLVAQFLKGQPTSELGPLKSLGIDVIRTEEMKKFVFQMDEEELAAARQNCRTVLGRVREAIEGGEYDLFVLDEVVDAVNVKLVDSKELLSILSGRAKDAEVVMTGRNPGEDLVEAADYLTMMTALKHPYQRGIQSRKGIEF